MQDDRAEPIGAFADILAGHFSQEAGIQGMSGDKAPI